MEGFQRGHGAVLDVADVVLDGLDHFVAKDRQIEREEAALLGENAAGVDGRSLHGPEAVILVDTSGSVHIAPHLGQESSYGLLVVHQELREQPPGGAVQPAVDLCHDVGHVVHGNGLDLAPLDLKRAAHLRAAICEQ